jgi:hypothetical protein
MWKSAFRTELWLRRLCPVEDDLPGLDDGWAVSASGNDGSVLLDAKVVDDAAAVGAEVGVVVDDPFRRASPEEPADRRSSCVLTDRLMKTASGAM